MKGKDTLLEVVDEFLAPCLDGLHHYLTTFLQCGTRLDQRERLASGNGNVWTHHYKPIARHRKSDRFETLAYSLGISRTAHNKKRTVGTKFRRFGNHLLFGHRQRTHLVQRLDHIGTVARTATHSCLCGNGFHQMSMHSRQLISAGKLTISLHHKILLLVAFHRDIGHLQVAVHRRRKPLVHRINLKGVFYHHWEKDCLKVVIAVGTLSHDIQS